MPFNYLVRSNISIGYLVDNSLVIITEKSSLIFHTHAEPSLFNLRNYNSGVKYKYHFNKKLYYLYVLSKTIKKINLV